MTRSAILFLGVLLLSATGLSFADTESFQLPSVLGDHMVLQRGRAAVWGVDRPGQAVNVEVAGNTYAVRADAKGRWRVQLEGLKAGGPYELVIAGSRTVTLKDVLVGEVWLGSGQSNMEMPLSQTECAKKDVPKADRPRIRLFLQPHAMAEKPRAVSEGRWVVCDPETAKEFSAAAYYFGLKIQDEMKVPVGLIQAAWGGSYIESWIPEDAYLKDPRFKPLLQQWKKRSKKDRDLWDGGAHRKLELSGLRFVPKDASHKPLTVYLGEGAVPKGELGVAWTGDAAAGSSVTFNTVREKGPVAGPVGRLTGLLWGGAWGFVATSLKPGDVPVDLSAYEAVEFYARGDGQYFIFLPEPSITDADNYCTPPFNVTNEWKKHRVVLSGLKQSGWGSPKPFTPEAIQKIAFGAVVPGLDRVPTSMYNGMIHPFTSMPLGGVLWYQGEANLGRADEYRKLLPNLIRSWRAAWGQSDLPFIVAQLPLFMDLVAVPSDSQWAEIREAQSQATAIPKVGLAVLMELGEAKDIHPKKKAEVGMRLAYEALHAAFGRRDVPRSPRFSRLELNGQKAIVHFEDLGKGLKVKNGRTLKGFAASGADGKFHWANAVIKGDTVVVECKEAGKIKAVRYAWADNPVCNLFGKNGLPVGSFRTDAP